MSKTLPSRQSVLEEILLKIFTQQSERRGTLYESQDDTTTIPSECRRLDSLARLITYGNTCAAICYDEKSASIYTANNDNNIEPARSYITCLRGAINASTSDEREASVNRLMRYLVKNDRTIKDMRDKSFESILINLAGKAESGDITISDFDEFVTQSIENLNKGSGSRCIKTREAKDVQALIKNHY